MDIYREEINRIVYDLRKMLGDYTNELTLKNDALGLRNDENLIRCKNNGKDTYYRAYRENGKYIRKTVGNDNKEMINALARKEYLETAISEISKNIEMIETLSESLGNLDFDTIRTKMCKACRELPEECFFAEGEGRTGIMPGDNEDRFKNHRKWASETYEKSDYMPERRRFMTSAGFRVRSKSEQHIVEQLVNYGIPFRYEQVIHADDISYSADFTFRDRNMELFYWEHAGMMDDARYAESHYRKMKSFEGIGIVPWKNLIVTYEADGAINIPMIKSIIENEVIPRL